MPKPLDAATRTAIVSETGRLAKALEALRQKRPDHPFLPEVEVFHKAAVWIVRHNEFYQPDAGAWTVEALQRGLERAKQLTAGETPWLQVTGRTVVRAYRSRVDNSVQPYAVTFPAGYGKGGDRPWRLDVVLHGRQTTLTEVSFLHDHNGTRAALNRPYVQLDIFGRGNNAYRWAGETDVYEAIENFLAAENALRRGPFEPRFVLRGFSMGGAGTWHLGLHRPDWWSVLGPGAGFTTTHGYVKDLPARLPDYQEACLHIYDAVDYAENAFNVPVVAYSGDKDPQYQAAVNIEGLLKPKQIPMKHIVAPGLGHQFPPEWQQKAEEEYARHATPGKGRKLYPDRVRFVTYTLKYPECAWVQVGRLERHYERAVVDARLATAGFAVKTENVRVLSLVLPEGASPVPQLVVIDGQEVQARPWRLPNGRFAIFLDKGSGRWQAVLREKLVVEGLRRPWKSNGQQGPIDDAFMSTFLCVRGTGKPWNDAAHRFAEANLERFRLEWDKFFRADLPIKNDADVTEDDLADRNLILFGDPGSNPLIAQVIDGLPVRWTRDKLTLAGQSYPAAGHVPVLIYPSPLHATGRYVVLNTGHTFRAEDLRGTNALLYPRLGDYAVLKPAPTEKDAAAAGVVTAGLFDEDWQIGKK
jgi:predicted esterase